MLLSIKNIKNIFKSKKTRNKKNLIIVEGATEIKMALIGNFKLKKIYICKKFFFKKKIDYCIINKFIIYINEKNYKKITYRKKTEGIIAIFFKKKINYEKKFINLIKKNKKILLLIIDNLEKPGNIGAIIRTVETTNIVNSIIINGNIDIYNPNIIRASLGCIFILSILILPIYKILKYILKYNINLLGTSIFKYNNCLSLYKINFLNFKKIAIIFGNEHVGISKIWDKFIYKNINIPMYGVINSLNVSNSVSIILFEILRQNSKYLKII
ncbi:MAG: RNA methyltransferase [Candidatus Shikimatogenerans sp. JK-2022]|nr:RNA methyltransferase [Candidatus Shikimatogenerans bostrichidophilus]